jgi:hypothetical protein
MSPISLSYTSAVKYVVGSPGSDAVRYEVTSEAERYSVGSDAVRYVDIDLALAYSVSASDSGNETKESLDDARAAVAYSLPSETVTNLSEATSDNISSERGVNGVTVCDSVIVLVKSDDGQMSYPVSLDEMGVWSPTPLYDTPSPVLRSSCKVKLPLPGV